MEIFCAAVEVALCILLATGIMSHIIRNITTPEPVQKGSSSAGIHTKVGFALHTGIMFSRAPLCAARSDSVRTGF